MNPVVKTTLVGASIGTGVIGLQIGLSKTLGDDSGIPNVAAGFAGIIATASLLGYFAHVHAGNEARLGAEYAMKMTEKNIIVGLGGMFGTVVAEQLLTGYPHADAFNRSAE